MEASVLNKDVGNIRVGQSVTVKLEAFPFTDYGTIGGKLVQLSRDAVQDEELGLVYQARVQLLCEEGVTLCARIAPGLSATADIHTRRRRIINYLLSPLSRRAQEAGREA